MELQSARRVSWRYTISTFSIFNSLSMIAVFWASSIYWISFVSPGHIVLTFLHAKQRAGVFLFLSFLPGAGFIVHLSGGQIPKPCAHSKAGKLSSLRRAVAVLWDAMIFPTVESRLQCATSLGGMYGELELPRHRFPPLGLAERIQRKGWTNTVWYQRSCRSSRKVGKKPDLPPEGLHSWFSFWVYSHSLWLFQNTHKAVGLFIDS
jgi:hypothetical protein